MGRLVVLRRLDGRLGLLAAIDCVAGGLALARPHLKQMANEPYSLWPHRRHSKEPFIRASDVRKPAVDQ